jgi:hypothetical protein
MRFATTLRGYGDVTTLLRDRESDFSASLERLLGRREWGVKALCVLLRLSRGMCAWCDPTWASAEDALENRSGGAAYLARKRIDQELTLAVDDLVAEFVSAATSARRSRRRRTADDCVATAEGRIFLDAVSRQQGSALPVWQA